MRVLVPRTFRTVLCVLVVFSVSRQVCNATHRIEYRWESPHVSLTLEDVVGTPVPPSYGFQVNVQNLGHKKRLFESFMRLPDGKRIGNKLTVHVSLYGIGDRPPTMELATLQSSAILKRPFTDSRAICSLLRMADGEHKLITDSFDTAQISVAKRLLHELPDDGFPVFSPSGQQVAFQSWRDDQLDVYIYDLRRDRVVLLNGSRATRRPLAHFTGILGLPKWSPDGKRVGYVCDGYLIVSEVDRGITRVLTPQSSTVTDFSWSPDGRLIVAVVSAPEDDIRYAQDVLLADPTGARPLVSLRAQMAAFSRGYFPVHLTWSHDSKKLAVCVNLTGIDLGTGGRYLTEEEMRTSVLYFVDVESLTTRTAVLPGHLMDALWDETDRAWVGALTTGDETNVVVVLVDTLAITTIGNTARPVVLLEASGQTVAYVDGERLMLAGKGKAKPEVVADASVQRVGLLPGIYGGYTGGSEDIAVAPEPAQAVVVVETEGFRPMAIAKKSGRVFLSKPGCFPTGWLASFVAQHGIVHLDWSPETGTVIASSSFEGGVIRILATQPGGDPANISQRLTTLPVRCLLAKRSP